MAGVRAYLAAHWRGLGAAFAGGVAVAGAAAGAFGLATVGFGLYDTTATGPHDRVVAWALHHTFLNSIRRRSAGISPPPGFSAAQVAAGFRQYKADCVMCHGGPGIDRARWVRQLEPSPPFVVDASRQFTPAQLYFILLKGVKMSAMPAWGETRTPSELWNYVAFLEALPTLSPADYRTQRRSAAADQAADTGAR